MLDANGYLQDFVERLTSINRGLVLFTPETLGDYVLVDFIEQSASSPVGASPAPAAAG